MKIKFPTEKIYMLFFLSIPIIFIPFLNFLYFILPGTEVGAIGDWIGFAGGYLGAILGICGIYWNINRQEKIDKNKKKENYKSFLKVTLNTIEKNQKLWNEKSNKFKKSDTFHMLFSNKKEFLPYFLLYDVLTNEYLTQIVENNHEKILELDSLLKEIDDSSNVFFKNIIKKKAIRHVIRSLEYTVKQTGANFERLETVKNNFLALSIFLSCDDSIKTVRLKAYLKGNPKEIENNFDSTDELEFIFYSEDKCSFDSFDKLYWRCYEELLIPIYWGSNIEYFQSFQEIFILDRDKRESFEKLETLLEEVKNIIKEK